MKQAGEINILIPVLVQTINIARRKQKALMNLSKVYVFYFILFCNSREQRYM